MKVKLNLETLEARDTPTTGITLQGSVIRIEGSAYNDAAYVSFDNRGTWYWWDDQINVSLQAGGTHLDATFNAGNVSSILFYGLDGNDWYTNNTGYNSTAYGGSGDDFFDAGGATDNLYGQDGADVLRGNAGNDNLYGGTGDDYLTGDDGDDYVSGEAGNDILLGGYGTDLLTGGVGNDNLNGGTADNYYYSYSDGANDTLYGDGGDDIFVQYHRRNWWGGWTDEDRLMDVGNGADQVYHVNVW